MKTFGDRLYDLTQTRSRLCVGIDPHPSLLEQWSLPVSARGLAQFSEICVEAFGPRVALVKPQVAFYEAFGSEGYSILEKTITGLKEAGALVVADAKRGDIGSTMAAYASAWLDQGSPLEVDAVTITPFMGFGSLAPALEKMHASDKGVFVLAATSNPEAGEIQTAHVDAMVHESLGEGGGDADRAPSRSISQLIVDHCAEQNRKLIADRDSQFGSCGVVIGATLAPVGHGSTSLVAEESGGDRRAETKRGEAARVAPRLDKLAGSILLPGVGAQGASAQDVKALTSPNEALACPNLSRGILKAGPDIDALIHQVEANAQDYPPVVID